MKKDLKNYYFILSDYYNIAPKILKLIPLYQKHYLK
jgi:hypothetical protein